MVLCTSKQAWGWQVQLEAAGAMGAAGAVGAAGAMEAAGATEAAGAIGAAGAPTNTNKCPRLCRPQTTAPPGRPSGRSKEPTPKHAHTCVTSPHLRDCLERRHCQEDRLHARGRRRALQGDSGDDAERALAADKQLLEVDACVVLAQRAQQVKLAAAEHVREKVWVGVYEGAVLAQRAQQVERAAVAARGACEGRRCGSECTGVAQGPCSRHTCWRPCLLLQAPCLSLKAPNLTLPTPWFTSHPLVHNALPTPWFTSHPLVHKTLPTPWFTSHPLVHKTLPTPWFTMHQLQPRTLRLRAPPPRRARCREASRTAAAAARLDNICNGAGAPRMTTLVSALVETAHGCADECAAAPSTMVERVGEREAGCAVGCRESAALSMRMCAAAPRIRSNGCCSKRPQNSDQLGREHTMEVVSKVWGLLHAHMSATC
eukprot:351548-Chlamydomonas_euryale.AAC.4